MSKRQRIYSVVCIWACVLLGAGCERATHIPMDLPEDGESLPKLLQDALDKRNDEYKARADERCREDAYVRAVRYVDSIIVGELQIGRLPQEFPSRPQRPALPEGIILNDSTAIEPI